MALFIACAFWLLVCWPVYEALGHRTGGTIGKRLVGLRSTTTGSWRPSPLTSIARGLLVAWPITIGLAGAGIPSVVYAGWLGWDAWRRTDGRHWVDRVTGSSVLILDALPAPRTRFR